MVPRAASRRRVLAPSDLVEAPPRARPRGRRVLVGGRVVRADLDRLRLADAYCWIDVALRSPPGLGPGDLAVVQGRHREGQVVDARVVEHRRLPQPPAEGEFARFCHCSVGNRLRQRARALEAIRGYFSRQRFIEVDTPLRVAAPGLDLHVDAIPAQDGWLVTSPEYHMKRLLAGGLPRVFQLCHCSRANEHGPLHEPEFMMLEWYRAFADQDAVMLDTERLVVAVVRRLTGSAELHLPNGHSVHVGSPFLRVTVDDAFRRYAGVDDVSALAAQSEDRFFELLVSRVEPALAQLPRPVFLHDYPIAFASLAQAVPEVPALAERFELYVGGVELCNGFGELTDPDEQRRRFQHDLSERQRRGLPAYPIDNRLLDALAEGMPRAGGNALGVDRLVALACGAATIAEVQAFPQHRR